MILSVSRRTDIPAFYSDWFFNRIKAGLVDVRNPMNIHRISRIDISPEVVDCIVFWTKNPEPILPFLKEIDDMDYDYYFQMTITDYEDDIEERIKGAGFVISGRFHGIVAAIQKGIPFIAIDICPKIRELTRDLGLEKYCIKISEVSKLDSLIKDSKFIPRLA